jgi:hypothetical protein
LPPANKGVWLPLAVVANVIAAVFAITAAATAGMHGPATMGVPGPTTTGVPGPATAGVNALTVYAAPVTRRYVPGPSERPGPCSGMIAIGMPPGGSSITDNFVPFFFHRGCTNTTEPSVRVMLKSTISVHAFSHVHSLAATAMW